MQMRAARLHGYHQPLSIEEIPVPDIGPDEVLVKMAAAGMCRSDVQLTEGYFAITPTFPITPGHENAGYVAALGANVPKSIAEGDLVVLNPNWGDGTCRQCHEGNEQICANVSMTGFGPPGGFAEYVPVPYRCVVPVPDGPDRTPEHLAPLTDAGLTPYRGMKKLRAAGKLGAGRVVVVNGIGGLGSYGVQYAKLLGAGATVVAFARSDEKLAVARQNGAEHTINTRDKSTDDVRDALDEAIGRRDVDAVLDCAAADESLALCAQLLANEGAMASVGLMGQRIELPLLPFTAGEKSYFGSFWGNHNDLTEVLSLAAQGLLVHNVTTVRFEDVNANLEKLARGDVVGRAVIVYD